MNPITAAFYDTVLMYGLALNNTLARKEDVKDGRNLSRSLWGQTFSNGNTALYSFSLGRISVIKGFDLLPGASRSDG